MGELSRELEASISRRARRRVLFVDDDVLLQELMTEVQQHLRIDVSNATTSGQARVLMMEKQFDLAVLDVGVVNGDGVALYRWIKVNLPNLNVIFLTAANIDQVGPEIWKIGSAVIYPKPTINTVTFLADIIRWAAHARKQSWAS